jgi:hypothetical protein
MRSLQGVLLGGGGFGFGVYGGEEGEEGEDEEGGFHVDFGWMYVG